MAKFTKNKIASLSAIIAIIIFATFFATYNKNNKEIANITNPTGKTSVVEIKTPPQATSLLPTEPKPTPKENTEIVTIIVGQDNINLSVAPSTIFYNALVEAQNTGKLAFSGKKYPGLGFFITEIQTLRAGDGKDLLYYINGKEATVGVSSYILKNGDVIEWKLE